MTRRDHLRLERELWAGAAADPGGERRRFLPPMSAGALAAYELALGVELPAEVRRFLLGLSAGGLVTSLGPPHLLAPDEAVALLRPRAAPTSAPCPPRVRAPASRREEIVPSDHEALRRAPG